MSSASSADNKTVVKYAAGAAAAVAVAGLGYWLWTKHKAAGASDDAAAAAGAGAGKDAKQAKAGAASDKPLPWPSAHVPSAYADAIQLDNGRFPTLGFGTLCSAGDKPAQIAHAVRDALKVGFRHIDCASAYNNEQNIGEVFAELIASDKANAVGPGQIRRKDLFVTSKLWGTDWSDVRGACLKTLSALQLEYLDLYLVHWPFENCPVPAEVKSGAKAAPEHTGYSAERYLFVWQQMEELVRSGLVRSIGVSNMTTAKLQALVAKCSIIPAVNQIECHPYLCQPKLIAYCKSKGIVVSTYFAIGSARRATFMRADTDPVLLDDPVVVDVARDCKATPAQVLIAWALHRGTVPIVKALSPARIKENWDSYAVALTAAQQKRIDALDRDYRYLKADIFAWPATQPWRALWDNEHVALKD